MSFKIYIKCNGLVNGHVPIVPFGKKEFETREEAVEAVRGICLTTAYRLKDICIMFDATKDLEKEFSIKK